MNFCPKCGRKRIDGSNFCQGCGYSFVAAIKAQSAQAVTPAKKHRRLSLLHLSNR